MAPLTHFDTVYDGMRLTHGAVAMTASSIDKPHDVAIRLAATSFCNQLFQQCCVGEAPHWVVILGQYDSSCCVWGWSPVCFMHHVIEFLVKAEPPSLKDAVHLMTVLCKDCGPKDLLGLQTLRTAFYPAVFV